VVQTRALLVGVLAAVLGRMALAQLEAAATEAAEVCAAAVAQRIRLLMAHARRMLRPRFPPLSPRPTRTMQRRMGLMARLTGSRITS
jgi:hypothetical protein